MQWVVIYTVVNVFFRDADSPITVLTGLDYWLDNLMCNVPEIAMCYHQGGFVQVGCCYNLVDCMFSKATGFILPVPDILFQAVGNTHIC